MEKQKYANNVFQIWQALKNKYNDFDHYNKKNPLNELLYILCSIKTNEQNYLKTYRALKRKFPTFRSLSKANEQEIADAIEFGGLGLQKAKKIKKILRQIEDKFGKPSLAPIKKMTNEEAEKFLTSLHGIGKKTARCIMLYSLGRQVFPVDVHCCRIAKRIGWIVPSRSDGFCSQTDMDILQELIPAEIRFSLHVNMVSLGRDICLPQNPKCGICPILKWCKHANMSVKQ